MNWQNYTTRRRIDVDQWLVRENINSRQDFLSKLVALSVEPPDEAMISLMFPEKANGSIIEDEPKSESDPTERIDTSSARSVAPQGGEVGLRPSGRDDGSKLRSRGNKSIR